MKKFKKNESYEQTNQLALYHLIKHDMCVVLKRQDNNDRQDWME